MSDLTVRYDNVYLYCERKQKASLDWRLWLDTRETAYSIIDYEPGEASELAVVPLRTWTFKNNDAQVDFEGLPILIYEDIVWEYEYPSNSSMIARAQRYSYDYFFKSRYTGSSSMGCC